MHKPCFNPPLNRRIYPPTRAPLAPGLDSAPHGEPQTTVASSPLSRDRRRRKSAGRFFGQRGGPRRAGQPQSLHGAQDVQGKIIVARQARQTPGAACSACSAGCSTGASCSASGAASRLAGIVVYYGAKMPAATTWSIPDRAAQHQDRLGRRPAARQSRHERRRGGRPARNVALYSRRPSSPSRTAASIRISASTRSAWRAPWSTNVAGRAFLAGRLDADAAAGQEPVPEARPHAGAQGAGSAAGAVAGAQAHQGPDPRNVPQPGLFRLGRLWRRGGLAPLFRQERARRHAVGGGACLPAC